VKAGVKAGAHFHIGGDYRFSTAWAAGRALSLGEAVTEALNADT
jgi:hypothetical protein